MIRLTVDEQTLLTARNRDALMGVLDSSRTGGKGNLVGFVGEELTAAYTDATMVDNYDYDILVGNLKVDVKTKSCSSPPKPHYLCSVMSYQLKNECDGYYFVRVNLASKEAWLLGYCSKTRLLEKGFFAKKGDPDGSFTFKEDCWNMEIKDLLEI